MSGSVEGPNWRGLLPLGTLWLSLAASSAGATTVADRGAEADRQQPSAPALMRFEYHNDQFVSRDDAFLSSCISNQRHSPLLRGWGTTASGEPRRGMARWIGENVPGLGPTGERRQRLAFGVTHAIQTPDDLRTDELQLDDVPYAGSLGAHWSWASFDDRALNAFQIYAGALGPAAGGRETQELFHDGLGKGPEPRGWRWQSENEPLLNLSYLIKRKIAPLTSGRRGFGRDLAVGFHQALGNYYTATDVQLELRAGWRLPEGFAQVHDPAGQGVSLEPVLDPDAGAESGSRFHLSLVLRATALWHTPFLDGNTFTESVHPGVDYEPVFGTVIAGLHFSRGRYSVHFSYHGSGLDADLSADTRTAPSWASIILEYRE